MARRDRLVTGAILALLALALAGGALWQHPPPPQFRLSQAIEGLIRLEGTPAYASAAATPHLFEIARHREKDALDRLRHELARADAPSRRQAILHVLGDWGRVERAHRYASHEAIPAEVDVVDGLSAPGVVEALRDEVRRALRDEDPAVRRAALRALRVVHDPTETDDGLGGDGEEDDEPPLVARAAEMARSDPDPDVRDAAALAWALLRMRVRVEQDRGDLPYGYFRGTEAELARQIRARIRGVKEKREDDAPEAVLEGLRELLDEIEARAREPGAERASRVFD